MLKLDKLNTEFNRAIELIKYTNGIIFLTGKAGTGKTTFLKYLLEKKYKESIVLAPTGVAAINAGGVTINSFFQIPFGPFLPNDIRLSPKEINKNFKFNNSKKELISKLELLIIDEVSMVRSDTLDVIDNLLRYFRKDKYLPFGGVQVLLIGDVFQLPPIVESSQWEILSHYYKSSFFFDSKVFRKSKPIHIEFKKLYRQKDEEFISLLNKVRMNKLSSLDLKTLNSRVKEIRSKDQYITLTTHRKAVNKINTSRLKLNKNELIQFEASVEGDFDEGSYPANKILSLKKEAQIMFIKNDTSHSKKYFNGKLGTVYEITEKQIIVKDNKGELIKVKPAIWNKIRYSYNKKEKKVEAEKIGLFVQFPLRLAWAITVHKSQGLTFESLKADLKDAFSPGQVYVALSRCTSLKGLYLESEIPLKAIKSQFNVLSFSKEVSPYRIIADKIAQGKSDFFFKESKKQKEIGKLNEALKYINKSLSFYSSAKLLKFKESLHKDLYQKKNKQNREITNSLRFSGADKKLKMEKLIKIIEANYNLLKNYIEMDMDKESMLETLQSQKKSTFKLLNNFTNEESVSKELSSLLTKEWWESLSQKWKKVLLLNIEIIDIYKNHIWLTNEWNKHPLHAYKNYYHKDFQVSENLDIKKILIHLNNLDSIIIYGIDDSLEPLTYLQNIKHLEINCLKSEGQHTQERYTYDFSILTQLQNLKVLKLQDLPDDADLSSLKDLKNLIYLYKDGNSSIPYLKNLKVLKCSGDEPEMRKDDFVLENVIILDIHNDNDRVTYDFHNTPFTLFKSLKKFPKLIYLEIGRALPEKHRDFKIITELPNLKKFICITKSIKVGNRSIKEEFNSISFNDIAENLLEKKVYVSVDGKYLTPKISKFYN
ncbi:ATP-dependent DNA helicase [Polaribacter dokdonensis]|uniref:PIF1 helicase n=1 Tax=Polaribacter dokdonensis DSW-5 TaxID=1300348 RepID=A0A0N0CFK0_9FLAO|nr:DEAD/DEAH box helicase [Polaribacter dokdonensis]KOY51947.1 PIF1 helicase [Polaribacter dokdonensis DSW-5]SED99254.1 PIF1-like helicase [Polaribacter dokdonensis DSW-5]